MKNNLKIGYLSSILIVACTFYSCNPISKLYTSFADAKKIIEAKGDTLNVVRIYFDRWGYIYPSADAVANITDDDIKSRDSRLVRYYQKNNEAYKKICSYYGADASEVNDSTKARFVSLQTALINKYTEFINYKATNKTLVFIIHGFNCNPLLPVVNGVHEGSYDQFKATRDDLKDHFPNKSFLFVEIYWDGMNSDNGGQKGLTPELNAFKFWPNAQVSATYAGLELRRIFSGLNSSDIYVITHSHGAGVITTALFNNKKFDRIHNSPNSLYTNESSWLYDINNEYNSNIYKTPLKTFYVGMLAPAIPGGAVFSDYGHRTINGKDTLSSFQNYHFIVGFNENDQITSKFGVLAKHYGSTSLGSVPAEYDYTSSIFRNDTSIMDKVDFAKYGEDSVQVQHAWLVYLKHQPQILKFFDRTIK